MTESNSTYGGQSGEGKLGQEEVVARARIGRNIVYAGLSAVGVLGGIAIITSSVGGSPEKITAVKDILSTLLPVIGVWVGTVLAFYFSKENYQAAASQSAALVHQLTTDQRLQTISVSDAMIPMDRADVFPLKAAEKDVLVRKHIIEEFFDKTKRNRAPFVADGKVKYVVHRSYFADFVMASAFAKTDSDKLSLEEFLAASDNKRKAEAFRAVGPKGTLAEVKAMMDTDCSDVFVTETGLKDGRAIGWITNIIVQERSTA